jgi:hypothetical protein
MDTLSLVINFTAMVFSFLKLGCQAMTNGRKLIPSTTS